MKHKVIIEDTGVNILAFIENTPIVTEGDNMDQVMEELIKLVDDYTAKHPDNEQIEIGDVEILDDTDDEYKE